MTEFAEFLIIAILFSFFFLHILVMLKVLPITIIWGSRLKSTKQMYIYEFISLVVISIFILNFLQYRNFINYLYPKIISTIIYWIMSIFFILNTLGNFLSKNFIEKFVFGVITFLLSLMSIYLALN